MLPCLYCESAAGDLPQAIVFADEAVVAFLDWRQHAPGHVLIIPRRHLSASEVFAGTVGVALMRTAMRIAEVMRSVVDPDGVQVGAILLPGRGHHAAARSSGLPRPLGDDAAVTETSEDGHFHLHVLPRQYRGQLARIYPFGDEVASEEGLQILAARLRAALDAAGAKQHPNPQAAGGLDA